MKWGINWTLKKKNRRQGSESAKKTKELGTQTKCKLWVLNFQVARKNFNCEVTFIPAPLFNLKLKLAGKKVKISSVQKKRKCSMNFLHQLILFNLIHQLINTSISTPTNHRQHHYPMGHLSRRFNHYFISIHYNFISSTGLRAIKIKYIRLPD